MKDTMKTPTKAALLIGAVLLMNDGHLRASEANVMLAEPATMMVQSTEASATRHLSWPKIVRAGQGGGCDRTLPQAQRRRAVDIFHDWYLVYYKGTRKASSIYGARLTIRSDESDE